MYSQEQINFIVAEAKSEAFKAADEYFKTKLGGVDQYACGFAWTDILGPTVGSGCFPTVS